MKLIVNYDHKVIMALRKGLVDGILNYVLDVPLLDCFYTKKESTAYKAAAEIVQNDTFKAFWVKGYNDINILEQTIKKGLIQPIKWTISRHIDSNYKPFIEEL